MTSITYQSSRLFAQKETKARRGVEICKSCRAVNYHKRWQHDSEQLRLTRRFANVVTEHVLCPACEMDRSGQHQAKVIIRAVPNRFAPDLVSLATRASRKAWQKDPEQRIISIRRDDDTIMFMLSGSSLAVALAKKIRSAFKHVTLEVRYAKEQKDETLVRIHFVGTETHSVYS